MSRTQTAVIPAIAPALARYAFAPLEYAVELFAAFVMATAAACDATRLELQ